MFPKTPRVILFVTLLCGISTAQAQYAQQQGAGGIVDAKQQTLQGLTMAGQGLADSAHALGSKVVGKVVDHAQDTWETTRNVAQGINNFNQGVREAVNAVPGEIRSNIADTTAGIRETAQSLGNIAKQTGQFMGAVAPNLPPVTQMLNPHAWKESYRTYGDELNGAWKSFTDTAEAVAEGVVSKYCTSAEFSSSAKKPAKFVGHSFSITFLTGGCFFDEEALFLNKTKRLNCTEPSIVYLKDPATFTSKRKTAPEFLGKQCAVTKTFGESLRKVLFVFDGSSTPDMGAITSKISDELRGIVTASSAGTDAIAGQLQTFISSLKPGGAGPQPRQSSSTTTTASSGAASHANHVGNQAWADLQAAAASYGPGTGGSGWEYGYQNS